MVSQQNNGRISIANIIALVGLAGLGVITFYGILLHSSDGKPGGAILGAVAFVIGLAFLLFICIKAKGAEDNRDKWRYVEWGALAVYVVVAALFASPFQRFFYIVSEKKTLQQEAMADYQAIDLLYTQYDQQRKEFIENAAQRFVTYLTSDKQATKDTTFIAYVNGIGSSEESITGKDGWLEKSSKITEITDPQLRNLLPEIKAWNLMQIVNLAIQLDKKSTEAKSKLEERIQQFETSNKLIPVVQHDTDRGYYLDGYAKFSLGEPLQSTFALSLRSANGHTILGWIIYIVLHLLILLNYLVAKSSRIVGPTNRGNQTGGLEL